MTDDPNQLLLELLAKHPEWAARKCDTCGLAITESSGACPRCGD